MTDIVERLQRDLMEISYDNIEAMVREAAAEIERLRDHVDALLLVATAHEPEIERLREEVRQTRMRIADLEKQLFRATGRTP